MNDDFRRDFMEDVSKEDIEVIETNEKEYGDTERNEENIEHNKPVFYTEVIEKKPKRWGKAAIAITLAIGLAFGSAFGFLADNIIDNLEGKNAVYASQGNQYNYVIDKTVSPVVPIAKNYSLPLWLSGLRKAYKTFLDLLTKVRATAQV